MRETPHFVRTCDSSLHSRRHWQGKEEREEIITMNGRSINFVCVIYLFVLLYVIGLSTSSMKADGGSFTPKMCTSDEECYELCHQGNELHSRCDINGTCICDCSDESISTSYTSACEIRQPDGRWRDYCDNTCRETYRRPCRFCKGANDNVYNTCVCNKP